MRAPPIIRLFLDPLVPLTALSQAMLYIPLDGQILPHHNLLPLDFLPLLQIFGALVRKQAHITRKILQAFIVHLAMVTKEILPAQQSQTMSSPLASIIMNCEFLHHQLFLCISLIRCPQRGRILEASPPSLFSSFHQAVVSLACLFAYIPWSILSRYPTEPRSTLSFSS